MVGGVAWQKFHVQLLVRFRLARGSFATAVLRELVESDAAQPGESD